MKQDSNNVILGIHSSQAGDLDLNDLGHAWISITKNGKTTTYGLWPDWNSEIKKRPEINNSFLDTDIQVNFEIIMKEQAIASRYYWLTPAQSRRLEKQAKKYNLWLPTHNCASWALAITFEILGIDLKADDFIGFETPRQLGNTIIALEKKSPTSLSNPTRVLSKYAVFIKVLHFSMDFYNDKVNELKKKDVTVPQ